LHDRDVFSRIESEAGEGVARDKVRRTAETGDRDRAASELLRIFDFRLRHQPVIQTDDAADHIDGVGSC